MGRAKEQLIEQFPLWLRFDSTDWKKRFLFNIRWEILNWRTILDKIVNAYKLNELRKARDISIVTPILYINRLNVQDKENIYLFKINLKRI